jgi:hypothetical protein
MAVVKLASQDDVEASFGRSLTSAEAGRVDAILDKLSELFRRESGQRFTVGSSTVRLKVNGGRVYLPQVPLVEVVSVVDDDAVEVEYTAAGSWLTVDLASNEFVTVEYEHGSAKAPDLVRLAVADAARQVLSVDPIAATGVSQRGVTTGPFSDQYTYAGWAQGGSARLSPDDVALARSYRVKVPTVWVQSP